MDLMHRRRCAHPRDRIYSIRSLVEGAESIEVDYNGSNLDVFGEVVNYLWSEFKKQGPPWTSRSLEALAQASPGLIKTLELISSHTVALGSPTTYLSSIQDRLPVCWTQPWLLCQAERNTKPYHE